MSEKHQQEDDGAEAERDRDRHADQQQADDHQEKEHDIHGSGSFGFWVTRRAVFDLVADDQRLGRPVQIRQVAWISRNRNSAMPTGSAK